MSFWSGLWNGIKTIGNGLLGGLPGLAINLGGSLISSLFGSKQASKQQQINYEQALKLADYQAQIQREQFDYTNEYNAPAAQMQRLADAGLNTNLALGNIATASMPQVSQPHMQQMNPAALMNFQVDLMRQVNENKKVEEEIKSMKLDNEYKEKTMYHRVEYQQSLAGRMYELYEMSKDDAVLKQFEVALQQDIRNCQQLLLHGEDADLVFNHHGGWNFGNDMNEYVKDLMSSELFNSIRDTMRQKSLSANEMSQRINVMAKQIEKYTEDVRYMKAHAAVEEFYASLAAQGINPHDPLWARVLGSILEKAGVNIIDKGASAVNWLKDWFE